MVTQLDVLETILKLLLVWKRQWDKTNGFVHQEKSRQIDEESPIEP